MSNYLYQSGISIKSETWKRNKKILALLQGLKDLGALEPEQNSRLIRLRKWFGIGL